MYCGWFIFTYEQFNINNNVKRVKKHMYTLQYSYFIIKVHICADMLQIKVSTWFLCSTLPCCSYYCCLNALCAGVIYYRTHFISSRFLLKEKQWWMFWDNPLSLSLSEVLISLSVLVWDKSRALTISAHIIIVITSSQNVCTWLFNWTSPGLFLKQQKWMKLRLWELQLSF